MYCNSNYTYLDEKTPEVEYICFLNSFNNFLSKRTAKDIEPYRISIKPEYVHSINNYYFKIIKMVHNQFNERYKYKSSNYDEDLMNHVEYAKYFEKGIIKEENDIVRAIVWDQKRGPWQERYESFNSDIYYYATELFFKITNDNLPVIQKIRFSEAFWCDKMITKDSRHYTFGYDVTVKLDSNNSFYIESEKLLIRLHEGYSDISFSNSIKKVVKKEKPKKYDLISFDCMLKDSVIQDRWKFNLRDLKKQVKLNHSEEAIVKMQ